MSLNGSGRTFLPFFIRSGQSQQHEVEAYLKLIGQRLGNVKRPDQLNSVKDQLK